jgi:hypothetical protein
MMFSSFTTRILAVMLGGISALSWRALAGLWQSGPGCRFMDVQPGASGKDAVSSLTHRKTGGFTPVPSGLAGIVFSNSLPAKLMTENRNFMNGSGVAAGDFDNDGKCDLFFCAIDGTNALYRNLGQWHFEDVTAAAGVGCPSLHSTGATLADLNGDGRLDLLVATLGHGAHCFLNQGNGRFRENTMESGLGGTTGSMSLALGDVDGNGTLDLFVANYGAQAVLTAGGAIQMTKVNGQWVIQGPHANRLRYVDGRLEEVGEASCLYLNDGQAHFRPVPWNSEFFLDEDGTSKPAPLDYSLAVQMRDINGDRFPDLYVCNDFQTPDRIWINDGRGHFRALPRLAMRKQCFASMGVDFADVDRDGHLDFMVTEMASRDHSRRQRQISGMQHMFPVPGMIDNRPEVVRNTFFVNRGDDTFAETANFSGITSTDWTWQPVFMDVDLDGFEDLLIVNGFSFDVQDRDLLKRTQAMGRLTPEQNRANLLLYPPFLTPNMAFRNRHDLTFEEASDVWGFDSRQISQGMAMADLDGDGGLDLIINGVNATPLLLRNICSAPLVSVRLNGRHPNVHGIGATVRLLGGPVPVQMQEILCGGRYLSGDDTLRVFAAGSLSNKMTLEVLWRGGKNSRIADVRANRIYVIDEPSDGTPKPVLSAVDGKQPYEKPLFQDVSTWINHEHHEEAFNDYARQPLLTRLLSQLGPGVAWFDMDGDGHDELILGTGKGGAIDVYRGNGSAPFLKLTQNPLSAPDDICGLAAWTAGDGQPILLAGLANYESGATNGPAVVSLRRQSAGGSLELSAISELMAWGASPGPLAVTDMDGDGTLELFVGARVIPGAYPQAASSRIYRQMEGRLIPDPINNPLLEKAGLISGAVWSDLDGDGYPELLLACEWGPIRAYKNNRGRLREATAELGLADFTGFWNGVATGDFDGDGRMDIVASNWGLNSEIQASHEHPAELYFGDLAGTGIIDLVETCYAPEIRAVAPKRSLNALCQAFPWLAERYATHEAFSTATVADLCRDFRIQPQRVSAAWLATTLFLNRGSNFTAQPLPAEAQFAPAFAIGVGDADGDGHEDVFLSQNCFALRPELPRLDGGRGLWLAGDGRGGLTPLSGQQSGVKVYGEQRGAALGDFNEDGRMDLVVMQNGAATRLYQNQGARPGLRVRLKGPPGNPSGIGAVIRLQFPSRMGPAREIHAGSGYWSQDSIVPVLGCPELPSKIHVLWPGGQRQENDIPSGAREIVVEMKRSAR